MKTLQYMFIQSKGRPVHVGDLVVMQTDCIPIERGTITIRFIEGQSKDHGVRLKCKNGWIELSDGTHAETLYIWRQPGLPDEITHRVHCPDGKLRFCNVYRIFHHNGYVSEDRWTGNAGIVRLSEQANKRMYGCSRGDGDFNPRGLVVEVEWSQEED